MLSFTLLFRDLLTLLRPYRLTLLLSVGLLVQVAYWHLGSPGPQLGGVGERSLETALQSILWALVLFFAVPFTLLRLTGYAPKSFGVRWGDVRFGLKLLLASLPVVVAGLWVGSSLPELQATYPWAGSWPGRSPQHLLAWAGLYALYYAAYEFFYRGFLLRGLEPYWGLTAAVWFQTACSALIHLGKPLSETLGVVPVGLVFALVAVRSRSVLWPFLLHLLIGLTTDIFSLWRQGWL